MRTSYLRLSIALATAILGVSCGPDLSPEAEDRVAQFLGVTGIGETLGAPADSAAAILGFDLDPLGYTGWGAQLPGGWLELVTYRVALTERAPPPTGARVVGLRRYYGPMSPDVVQDSVETLAALIGSLVPCETKHLGTIEGETVSVRPWPLPDGTSGILIAVGDDAMQDHKDRICASRE